MKLSELIHQDQFESPGHEAILNVLVTSSWVTARLSEVMGRHGVTPAQYNLLRILRGSDPNKMTCSDIGSRLLDRTPDVTRLLNRLEKAQLIVRGRSRKDRRIVQVGITQAGRDLLSVLDPVVTRLNESLVRHLGVSDLVQLSALLERLRTDQTA